MMPATPTKQSVIYDDLCADLESGTLSPGSALPSLRQLSSQYDSSVGTVRAALLALLHEGRIIAQHGSGYYVAEPPKPTLKTVLLVAPIEGDLWSEFVQLFTDKLAGDPDKRLILERPPQKKGDAFTRKIERYLDDGVDTMIVNGNSNISAGLLEHARSKTHLICYSANGANIDCDMVVTDYVHGGRIGATHLIERGAKHIMFLVPPSFHLSHGRSQRKVFAGCEEVVQDRAARLEVCIADAFADDFSDIIEAKLDASPSIDAIYSFCDFRFETLIPMFNRTGRRIPEDIRLLGYYDTPWCHRLTPSLSSTSIRPPVIVDAVIEIMRGVRSGTQTIQPCLIARDSS